MSKEAEGDREVLGYKVTMCGKNQMKEFKVYFLNRVELCQQNVRLLSKYTSLSTICLFELCLDALLEGESSVLDSDEEQLLLMQAMPGVHIRLNEGGMCKKSKQSIGNLEDERWEMYWNNCRGDVYLILEICCLVFA